MFQKYSSPIAVFNLTKATNAREETVAAEYRNFVNLSLNKELPDALKIDFLHYDVKINKKKVKNFPYDILDLIKKRLEATKFFSCVPCSRTPYDASKPNRESRSKLCRVEI